MSACKSEGLTNPFNWYSCNHQYFIARTIFQHHQREPILFAGKMIILCHNSITFLNVSRVNEQTPRSNFIKRLKVECIAKWISVRTWGARKPRVGKPLLTCVCKRSMLDATVKAVVVVVMDDWLVQARTGTVAVAWRCCCRWRCGCCCCCCCCSTSLRVTATARWLPLLLSLSPFGECSCPATGKGAIFRLLYIRILNNKKSFEIIIWIIRK